MEESQKSNGSEQRREIRFTDVQARTITAALTILAASIVIGFGGFFLWLLARFFTEFSGVLVPLLVAAVLTLLLKPFYNWLHQKRGFRPALAVAVIMISVFLPLLLLLGVSGFIIFKQGASLIENIPGWYEKILASGGEFFPIAQDLWDEYEIGVRLTEFMETNTSEIAVRVQNVISSTIQAGLNASSWLGNLLGWLMVPVYLAFFLSLPPFKPAELEEGLPFLKSETRKNLIYLLTEFFAILAAFFRGQLIVALAQGLLYAFGFWAVGLEFGFAIGFALGLLNIVPYLGNIVGLAVALPTAYFQSDGGWMLLGLTLVVFAVVQLIEGMVLTPKIMGEKTGLHPVVIIIAILFWGTALNGIAGMILAIPLTAFLVVFWRLLREKYILEII